MPLTYNDPVSTYSDAVFTNLELERIREIVGAEAVSTVSNVVGELSADQRRATRYDIDLYINEIGEGTVAVQGASDGTDYSQTRDRNEIRRRVAMRLGLAVPVSPGGLFRIPIVAGYDCYEDD